MRSGLMDLGRPRRHGNAPLVRFARACAADGSYSWTTYLTNSGGLESYGPSTPRLVWRRRHPADLVSGGRHDLPIGEGDPSRSPAPVHEV